MEVNDFEKFFKELHNGRTPFPWQNQLMEYVAKKGWPTTLDLPTAAGKTAAIDIALFHLALEADKPPNERRAPLRIFFIVDRRIVVDEAYDRSCQIRDLLKEAKDGTLAEVAQGLKKLASENDSKPLEVVRLRGGMPLERAFIRNPLQPTIVLSTVDQIGSRLLFRGYGVSPFMRPIHAALVGMDSIIILDEAHLSRPFEETLDWAKRYQSEFWAEKRIGRSTTIVRMTATPSATNENVFSPLKDPDCADWKNEFLSPRLNCAKLARLISIKGDIDDTGSTRNELVETLAKEATSLMIKTHEVCETPVVGVIANRVATARQVFARLCIEKDSDTILLTGRNRPFERDELVKEYLPRIKAGRGSGENLQSLYVVATQTIEVGADIDFDALVTEASALDALRQRFGRLNRLGSREKADAVIVYVDYGRNKIVDPIYGEALAKTWNWINRNAEKPQGQKFKVIDFGISAINPILPNGDKIEELLTPRKNAPVLMPAHLDMLVQTSPQPAVEPEIALFLHGENADPEDVQIIWRADLPNTLASNGDNDAIASVSLLPPTKLEALSIPIRAAYAFLDGIWRDDIEISDVEGERKDDRGEHPSREESKRYAVQWHGAENSGIIRDPNDVKPGYILVVPSSYGGLDRFGWNPVSNRSVRDIGDEAASMRSGKKVLRIHKNLISQWFEAEESVPESVFMAIENTLNRFKDGEDLSKLCDELIEKLINYPRIKENIREKLEKFRLNRLEIAYPDIENPHGILMQEYRNSPEEFTDDDDTSSLIRETDNPKLSKKSKVHEVLLDSHCNGVAELANVFASHLGLSDEITRDLAIAGKLHDLGKADPRFQAWLWNGDRIAMRKANKILAKSSVPVDQNSIRLARRMAGYPEGTRHECYSAAIALQNIHLLNESNDKDLILYLIGAHHGRGRPFLPSIDDNGTDIQFEFGEEQILFRGKHNLEQLDSGWPERFWSLNRSYGYWGLAYLETLLRLADHRRSEQGE